MSAKVLPHTYVCILLDSMHLGATLKVSLTNVKTNNYNFFLYTAIQLTFYKHRQNLNEWTMHFPVLMGCKKLSSADGLQEAFQCWWVARSFPVLMGCKKLSSADGLQEAFQCWWVARSFPVLMGCKKFSSADGLQEAFKKQTTLCMNIQNEIF